MKRLFSLIIILAFLISCGNPIGDLNNNNDGINIVITVDPSETYEVRMGSKVIKTTASTMTNDWTNYIGGKKVLKPDGRTDLGWYYKEGTGDYYEPSFSTIKPRANFMGVLIVSNINRGVAYLSGIYYNNKLLEGHSQYMLIYIQADGQERGYYGGGANISQIPDSSTVWTHYQSPVDPLGILKNY